MEKGTEEATNKDQGDSLYNGRIHLHESNIDSRSGEFVPGKKDRDRTGDAPKDTGYQQKHMGISLQDLPLELVVLIFSTLSAAELCRVMGVCSSWRELAEDEQLWKKLYFELQQSGVRVTSGFRAKVIEVESRIHKWRQQLKRNPGRKLTKTLKSTLPLSQPIKVVVIGDNAVGKTCFLYAHSSNVWQGRYVPTVFEVYSAPITIDGKSLIFSPWDSVDSRPSFEHIREKWVLEATGKAQHRYWAEHTADMPFVLVGLKTDLYEDTSIPPENFIHELEARAFAAEIGALGYYPVSSLKLEGLNEAMEGAVSAAIYEIEVDKPSERQKRCAVM